ncbi:MAG: LysE family translocator [Rhodobacteraceae bacterium]|nr:LysE family translocator [Paracoccaceae bacterium]MCP5341371.1 LysE family translocator [Paracoccaceae bacterium]
MIRGRRVVRQWRNGRCQVSFDVFLTLLALAVATLFTPGPNNMMLAASGANFGLRPSFPHLFGVAFGFPLMLLTVGLVLGGLVQASPALREGLRYGGAVLLLWIAWKIATSGGIGSGSGAARPMRFFAAASFQWVNPKAWSMAVAATSQYVIPDRPIWTAGLVAVTFLTLGLVSATTWVLAGKAIAHWLTTARRLRIFNLVMAVLIVASMIQLIVH